MTGSPAAIRYRRADGVFETPVDDEGFLAVPATDAIFHLNAVGRALWALLAEPRTREELESLVGAAFPDAPQRAVAGDIAAFLGSLEASALIEKV